MPPTKSVCVIGCGPGGIFFLHALATRRRKLERELEKESNLPFVECFEKSSSSGGVWRSAASSDDGPVQKDIPKSHDGKRSVSPRSAVDVNSVEESHSIRSHSSAQSTQMYEALWINGSKECQEFFDYTYDEHFKTAMPVYLRRKDVLDYILCRVTKKENIFERVHFNTTVISVDYCAERKLFDVCTRDDLTGSLTQRQFTHCIWSGGLNAKARMPVDIINVLREGKFQGRVIHSTEMKDFEATVRGKRVLLVGDSYSAEDLALQSLKLGAERVFISSYVL